MTIPASIAAALLAVLAACADAPDLTTWQRCTTGALCPPGTACAPDGDACLAPPSCGDTPDSEPCEDLAPSCGDGLLHKRFERCDDGNARSGDGCDTNCTLTRCGNGILTASEACDDGNLLAGDGCEPDCTLTPIQADPRPACRSGPAGTCRPTYEPLRATP